MVSMTYTEYRTLNEDLASLSGKEWKKLRFPKEELSKKRIRTLDECIYVISIAEKIVEKAYEFSLEEGRHQEWLEAIDSMTPIYYIISPITTDIVKQLFSDLNSNRINEYYNVLRKYDQFEIIYVLLKSSRDLNDGGEVVVYYFANDFDDYIVKMLDWI